MRRSEPLGFIVEFAKKIGGRRVGCICYHPPTRWKEHFIRSHINFHAHSVLACGNYVHVWFNVEYLVICPRQSLQVVEVSLCVLLVFDIMAKTVFSYDLVRKKGEYGSLRVIGLAREEGHRSCKSHGLGSLRTDGIKHIWLSGKDLEHRANVNRPWRNLERGCYLRVLPADEDVALSIVEADRAYISRMHANVWDVDRPMEHGARFHDLVIDNSLGGGSLDSVELKVHSNKGIAKKMAEDKIEIKQRWEDLASATSLYSGMVLLVAKVRPVDSSTWGHPELIGLRWDGSSWKSWKPQCDMPIRSPLMLWDTLEAAVLQDSSAFVRFRSTMYFKVGRYLELQNETDPSGRVAYWKNRGFLRSPEIKSEILRPSGASACVHGGVASPSFRLRGGSRGIFVKKTILKRIHSARLRGAL